MKWYRAKWNKYGEKKTQKEWWENRKIPEFSFPFKWNSFDMTCSLARASDKFEVRVSLFSAIIWPHCYTFNNGKSSWQWYKCWSSCVCLLHWVNGIWLMFVSLLFHSKRHFFTSSFAAIRNELEFFFSFVFSVSRLMLDLNFIESICNNVTFTRLNVSTGLKTGERHVVFTYNWIDRRKDEMIVSNYIQQWERGRERKKRTFS